MRIYFQLFPEPYVWAYDAALGLRVRNGLCSNHAC